MSIAISIAIVFHLLGLLSIVNAITDARTPQGSIAWVIFLISCPYIALPAYWLLGRSRFHGYVSARRSEDEQTQNKLNQVRKQLARSTRPGRRPVRPGTQRRSSRTCRSWRATAFNC